MEVERGEENQSAIHSSVRSAIRRARLLVGEVPGGELLVRSARGMVMSGSRVEAAER